MLMRTIRVLDTTLRDGEQAPGCTMNSREKLEIALQLERLGVDVIEAGFPVASPEDFRAVSSIAEQVKNCAVAARCRARKGDIEAAAKALSKAAAPVIHIFIATSDLHLRDKLGITREQELEVVAETVAYAKTFCGEVEFSAEDATRSDRNHLLAVFKTAAENGATVLNIADTVGYITPAEMGDLVRFVREGIKGEDVRISVHCHNDLGMAVANSISALEAGADQFKGSINGMGERAGNVALEEVVMALETRRELLGLTCRINRKQIYRTSLLVSTVAGLKIAPNKPIVGRNAFVHEAGIHQHGVMKNPLTYEIMSPESIGIYDSDLALGKHSGRHAFAQRVEELGYNLTPEALEKIFVRFMALADRKKQVTNRDIEALITSAGYTVPEVYSLDSFVVNTGSVISSTAVVKLLKDGEPIEQVSRGQGPIDAAFKAIDQIVQQGYQLTNYTIHSVTEGEDALGEVTVKLRRGEHRITGRGLSTDIFEASLKAYLNAINKVLTMQDSAEETQIN